VRLGGSQGHPCRDPGGPLDTLVGYWGVLGRSLGDPVVDLVPHMLRTPMLQSFALFSAECILGFCLNAFGGAQTRKSCILRVLAYLGVSSLGAVRLQGFPWESPCPPGGRPGAPYAMHTDVSAFLIVLC